MRKCSLFGFLTYAFEFVGFVAIVFFTGSIDSEVAIGYFVASLLSIVYIGISVKRAQKSDLCISAKIKGILIPTDSTVISNILCTAIPLIAHIILNLTVLGDVLVCSITAFFVLYKSNVPRSIITGFAKTAGAYKVILDKGNIVLLFKGGNNFPQIDIDDTLELAHIAGDYYLLRNVIKPKQKDQDTEKTQEK